MTVSVLLIDDERSFRVLLERALVREGYEVRSAGTGAEARRAWAEATCDLVVVDRNLPDGDGIELLHDLRVDADDRNLDVAFLMVTAYADVEHAVEALKRGADDYITKPVRPKVFVSKVKALLKRSGSERPEGQVLEANGVRVDLEKVTVQVGEQEMHLPKKEFELLVLLMSKPGKVFKRDEIYSQVWGNELFVGDRTIDVHIRKLREKIGNHYIKTIKGIGYKFEF